jgi:hypothetical protein
MSDVFYSQINSALRKELTARSMAGKLNRTTKGLDFMLGKIANVVLNAYDNIEDDDPVASIGGNSVTSNKYGGSYLASGKDGYLINESTRTGPVITGVSINIADQSQYAINTATVNIVLPDPSLLDDLEDTFLKPGRTLEIQVQHPESAILSGNTLLSQDEMLYTTRILKQQYGDNPEDLNQFFEMNKMIFNGLVDGFKTDFQPDATLTITISLRAVSSIYTDVSLFVSNPDIPNASIDQKVTDLFSEKIKSTINGVVEKNKKKYPNGFIQEYQVLDKTPVKSDRTILYGPLYTARDKTKYSYKTFISVGLLIDFLEKFLYEPVTKSNLEDSKKPVVPNMRIICNDNISKTNYYDELVSADPQRIFLYQGNEAEYKTNSYIRQAGTSTPITGPEIPTTNLVVSETINDQMTEQFMLEDDYTISYYDGIENIDNVPGFYQSSNSADETTKYGCLSRILIELETISEIESTLKADTKKPFTIKNFIIAISDEIKVQTGTGVFPGLIFHPELPSTLMYHDAEYLGFDRNVAEYEIPVFASVDKGTIVREMKLGYDLPDEFKYALFNFNAANISPNKASSYNSYLISGGEERSDQEVEWKKKHDDAKIVLAEAKSNLTYDYRDSERIKKLQAALQTYVNYPTPSLKESLNQQKPRWLYTLEFTIDGINGFRFGDVLQFRGIPQRFRDDFVFNVEKVTHNVDATGEWTTTLSCRSRTISRSII